MKPERFRRPDLVFPKHHAIVFVHGCFWHRHEGCRYTTTPSTRPKRMLESGEFTTMAELAEHEGIAPSYMTRVLRLTLIAPCIVEGILDGQLERGVTLAHLLEPFSLEWQAQSKIFMFAT